MHALMEKKGIAKGKKNYTSLLFCKRKISLFMTAWLECPPEIQWDNKNLFCLFYGKRKKIMFCSLFSTQQRQISSAVLPINLGEDFPASCTGRKIFQAFPLLIFATGTELFQMPAHKENLLYKQQKGK